MYVAVLFICFMTAGVSHAQGVKSSAPALLPISETGFEELRAKSIGRVLVLNFWATWCKPCIEKFPVLVELQKAYASKGLDVVFVSIDDDAKAKQKVNAFLKKMKVVSTSYIKETNNDEQFINAVNPKWSGAVPATFIYNKKGQLVTMKVEELNKAELERIVAPLLQK